MLLAVAFAMPSLCGADVWRWRDSAGELHYSNVQAHVPPYAERVTRPIGHVSLPPPAPPAERVSRPPLPVGEPGGAYHRHRYGPEGYGVPLWWAPGLAAPWVLRVNGDNLADQVKEASLLDALNVKWRGCCWR